VPVAAPASVNLDLSGRHVVAPLAGARCMDDGHHHLVYHHRDMVVETASQRLGGCRHDESEEGHDGGNPYTRSHFSNGL